MKISPLSWRRAKLKRKVSSAFAAETLVLSQAVAQVEWLQVMLRSITVRDVTVRDKSSLLSPFTALAPQDCQLVQVTSPSYIVHTKSLYNVQRKGWVGSRRGRGLTAELAKTNKAQEHVVAGTGNDETRIGTATSPFPIASRCRADSQRVLQIREGNRLGDSADAKLAVNCARKVGPLTPAQQAEGDIQIQPCRINENGDPL